MAWTSHGHHVPGSIRNGFAPTTRARCGGPLLCAICKAEVTRIIGEPTNYQMKAQRILIEYLDDQLEASGETEEKYAYEVYVIWFCKTLQNWKALLGTTLPDGKMYEITYDGDNKRTFLDEYTKINHRVIPD
jgi:hypothetical protein